MLLYRPLFRHSGKNFVFDPFSIFTYKTIKVGDDVYFGERVNIASITEIIIGNKVMIGPGVHIRGGDHNTKVLGKYMFDVTEKLPENDLPIKIEDDVWIGSNSVILKGVTIGKGSIVAAGAVVTRSCEPYSIIAGVPAVVIKKRFSESEIVLHEKMMRCAE